MPTFGEKKSRFPIKKKIQISACLETLEDLNTQGLHSVCGNLLWLLHPVPTTLTGSNLLGGLIMPCWMCIFDLALKHYTSVGCYYL